MSEASRAPAGTAAAAPLDVAALRTLLRESRLGTPLIYLPEIRSTNSHALELARQGASEGTLVTTDHQTAGRGRIGRGWQSLPRQQLALSLVLRPRFPPHFLVMASAVAVAEAIEETTGRRPALKWPNDVLLDGRKLCGILIETSGDVAVLGMGINVNGSLARAGAVAARAITLEEALGHAVSREALAAAVLLRLAAAYSVLQHGGAPAQHGTRMVWRARLSTLGQAVTIQQGGATIHGLAEDVDAGGALLLRGHDGARYTITWGDVE